MKIINIMENEDVVQKALREINRILDNPSTETYGDVADYIYKTNLLGNEVIQEFIFKHRYGGSFALIYMGLDIQPNIAKKMLVDPSFVQEVDDELYETFVREYFASNQLLINKWLRYAEAMRNQ